MNLAVHYISQAMSGTGQNGKEEINTQKLHKYLQAFAKKFFGQAWRLWLRGVGLETQEDIEAVVVEYLEFYHMKGGDKQIKTDKRRTRFMENYKKALKYLITNGCASLQEPCERFFEDHPGDKLTKIIAELTFDEGLEPSEFLYELGYVKGAS